MTVTIIPGYRCLPLPAIQLSLAVVLQCGQSFRWAIFPLQSNGSTSPDLPQHEYRLCLRDRVVSLRQNATHVFYKSTFAQPCQSQEEENVREGETLTWLRDYFQLDVDLVQLYDTWAKCDPVFERLKDRFSGVRVLRQDPFECLLSCVICSLTIVSNLFRKLVSYVPRIIISFE